MSGTTVYKMTGSGNDFVLLDGRSTTPAEWPAARVVQICDRRTGVGADGLVLLTPESMTPEGMTPEGLMPGAAARVRMAFWNSDGSRAALCGNAALCSARLAVYLELAPAGDLILLTDAGTVQARCPPAGDLAEIRLPDFELARGGGHAAARRPTGRAPLIELAAGEHWMAFATVGVPHLIVRVDDVEAVDLLGRGRSLRHDPRLGAAGANVNFVAPPREARGSWLIRTFERGVEGETLACGTGTVAAGVALAAHGEASLPIQFRSRGGEELVVRATLNGHQASDVWLGGQGKLVFRAVWEA